MGGYVRLIVLLLWFVVGHAACAIVHAGVVEPTISSDRIRDMLLGRITTWSDGTPVTIVLVDETASDQALKDLTGRDCARMLRGWKRLAFSGAGSMPSVVTSICEAAERIADIPGSIAVVDAIETDLRWRVLLLP